MRAPPYRIVTERLVVRCWEPPDAPLLKEAVDSSLDHLRPWMPWAHEAPVPLGETVELLRGFRGRFDVGQDFVYGILFRDESEVVGGSGLHTRAGADAFEIGYWIRASRSGEGLGTEAAAALTRAGIELAGARRIEIRVDPENTASLAIPRKLGFAEEGRLRAVLHGMDGTPMQRDAVVFSLLADELAGSPAGALPLEAFDAGGARLS
jgi:RimJ/RimL family protein N-acetyltransferase